MNAQTARAACASNAPEGSFLMDSSQSPDLGCSARFPHQNPICRKMHATRRGIRRHRQEVITFGAHQLDGKCHGKDRGRIGAQTRQSERTKRDSNIGKKEQCRPTQANTCDETDVIKKFGAFVASASSSIHAGSMIGDRRELKRMHRSLRLRCLPFYILPTARLLGSKTLERFRPIRHYRM